MATNCTLEGNAVREPATSAAGSGTCEAAHTESESPACGGLRDYPGLEVEDVGLVGHTTLSAYWLSERCAILTFRTQLAQHEDCKPALAAAGERWESGPRRSWRRAKVRLDGRRQLAEIQRHKYIVSQERGYDIGFESAARDWISKYASEWRAWWETQFESNPTLGRSFF